MERLTFEGNFCDIAQCSELPCPYGGNCSQKQVWERLKAYEGTGLTPEDIKSAITASAVINLAAQALGTEPDRLRELAEADKDGRLVVLPHEDYKWVIRGDLALGIVKANCRRAAEAEKALQEMEGKT